MIGYSLKKSGNPASIKKADALRPTAERKYPFCLILIPDKTMRSFYLAAECGPAAYRAAIKRFVSFYQEIVLKENFLLTNTPSGYKLRARYPQGVYSLFLEENGIKIHVRLEEKKGLRGKIDGIGYQA